MKYFTTKDGFFSGNVGIGTTDPGIYKLLVNDNTTSSRIKISSSNTAIASLLFGEDAGGGGTPAWLNRYGSSHETKPSKVELGAVGSGSWISIQGDGADILNVRGSGNVGIGTTDPSHDLTLGSPTSTGTTDDRLKIYRGADDAGQNLEMGYRSITVTRDANVLADPQSTFSIKQKGSDGERVVMQIDPSGNVGIGTIIPSAKLQVNTFTDVTSTTVACINGQNTISLSENLTSKLSAGDTIRFNNPNTGDISKKQYEVDSITSNLLTLTQNLSFSASLYISKSQSTLNVESGNVGIGTTNPSANLEIEKDSYGDLSAGQGHMVLDTIGVAREEGKGPFINFRVPTSSSTSEDMANIGAVCSDSTSSSRKADLVFWTRDNTFSEKMRINASGNVGIGTASPSFAKLHINGSSATSDRAGLLLTDSNTTGRTSAIHQEGKLLKFDDYSQGITTIAIDGINGNVGIGTTSPDAMLDVYGDSPKLNLVRSIVGGGVDGIELKSSGNGSTINERSGIITLITPASGTEEATLLIGTKNGSTDNPTLYLKDGNVGIGTTSPSAKLHITDAHGNDSTSASGQLKLSNIHTNGGTWGIHTTAQYWNAGAGGKLGFFADDNANQARMIITQAGKVGIGTTDPIKTLHVNGAVHFEKGNGSDNDPSNPVFVISGNGYSGQMTADSTAFYIGQNSHIRELRMWSGALATGVKLANLSTSWGTYSDEKLKTNITDVGSVLDKISGIRCVNYELIHDESSQKRIGFIAQDFVDKFDEVVEKPSKISNDVEGEYLGLRYTEIVPVIMKAVQEQQTMIQELKSEIDSLKFQLNPDNSSSTQEPVVKEALEESVAEEAQPEEVATEEPQEVAQVSLGASISSTSLDDISNSRAEEL